MTKAPTATAPAVEAKPLRDPSRILQITANLLPAEIIEARRGSKLRWLILAVLIVVIAALVAWDVHARQQTDAAQSDLGRAQTNLNSVTSKQQQYSAINTTKNASKAIGQQLTGLMAQDLPWWRLMPTLNSTAASAGVQLSNIVGTLSTANAAGTGSQIPGITNADAVGTLTLTGTAPDQAHIAAYLDLLAKTTGLADPYLSNSNAQNGNYQFTMLVEFTSALYGGRYSSTSGTTGGK